MKTFRLLIFVTGVVFGTYLTAPKAPEVSLSLSRQTVIQLTQSTQPLDPPDAYETQKPPAPVPEPAVDMPTPPNSTAQQLSAFLESFTSVQTTDLEDDILEPPNTDNTPDTSGPEEQQTQPQPPYEEPNFPANLTALIQEGGGNCDFYSLRLNERKLKCMGNEHNITHFQPTNLLDACRHAVINQVQAQARLSTWQHTQMCSALVMWMAAESEIPPLCTTPFQHLPRGPSRSCRSQPFGITNPSLWLHPDGTVIAVARGYNEDQRWGRCQLFATAEPQFTSYSDACSHPVLEYSPSCGGLSNLNVFRTFSLQLLGDGRPFMLGKKLYYIFSDYHMGTMLSDASGTRWTLRHMAAWDPTVKNVVPVVGFRDKKFPDRMAFLVDFFRFVVARVDVPSGRIHGEGIMTNCPTGSKFHGNSHVVRLHRDLPYWLSFVHQFEPCTNDTAFGPRQYLTQAIVLYGNIFPQHCLMLDLPDIFTEKTDRQVFVSGLAVIYSNVTYRYTQRPSTTRKSFLEGSLFVSFGVNDDEAKYSQIHFSLDLTKLLYLAPDVSVLKTFNMTKPNNLAYATVARVRNSTVQSDVGNRRRRLIALAQARMFRGEQTHPMLMKPSEDRLIRDTHQLTRNGTTRTRYVVRHRPIIQPQQQQQQQQQQTNNANAVWEDMILLLTNSTQQDFNVQDTATTTHFAPLRKRSRVLPKGSGWMTTRTRM